VDRVHGSALHSGRCTACREAQTNFYNESACLTADNILNEVDNTQITGGVENAALSTCRYLSQLIVS
jgi:hypothetical protein